jgi:hypothetical protein
VVVGPVVVVVTVVTVEGADGLNAFDEPQPARPSAVKSENIPKDARKLNSSYPEAGHDPISSTDDPQWVSPVGVTFNYRRLSTCVLIVAKRAWKRKEE